MHDTFQSSIRFKQHTNIHCYYTKNTFTRAHISLGSFESKCNFFDAIVRSICKTQYDGSPLGGTMLGFGASLVPQCDYADVTTILPFAAGFLPLNTGIPFNPEALIESLPSCQKIGKLVTSNAIDTVLLTQESIHCNSNIHFTCDNGNTRGNKNSAKFTCWYDKKYKKSKYFCSMPTEQMHI